MPKRSSHLDGTSPAFPPTRASDTSWDGWDNGTAVGATCATSTWVRISEPRLWVPRMPGGKFYSEDNMRQAASAALELWSPVDSAKAKMLVETQKSNIQMDFRCLLNAVTPGMTFPAQGISASWCCFNSYQWNIPMFSSQRSKRLQVKHPAFCQSSMYIPFFWRKYHMCAGCWEQP